LKEGEALKLMGRILINGRLKARTGLRIGGSKEVLEVGGLDLPVIKDPFGVPYIPGSSLRGKIRSLLELHRGKGKFEIEGETFCTIKDFFERYNQLFDSGRELRIKGSPCCCGECEICKLFGIPANENKFPLNPTRLAVRDAFLDKDHWNECFKEAEVLGGTYTEVKYENSIDRLTSVANPRQVERVPAGARFDFEMSLKLLDESDVDLLKTLFEGMKLLEDDYLGGHGSRGYGAVKFEDISIRLRGRDYYEGEGEEEEVDKAEDLSEVDIENIINTVKGKLKEEKEGTK